MSYDMQGYAKIRKGWWRDNQMQDLGRAGPRDPVR